MKQIRNYLLQQVAGGQLDKETATGMLVDLLETRQGGGGGAGSDGRGPVAVVGLALRLPDAPDPDSFWTLLAEGRDLIRPFPERRRDDVFGVSPEARAAFEGRETFDAAFLDRIDLFDAAFFNVSPGEAKVMDPQQRLFLEVAWEALEGAGYGRERLYGSRAGVYVGYSENRYGDLISGFEPSAIPGNLPAVLASRLAYLFDLSGPTQTIDTTCSSSLVALHQACQGLWNGDCSMAVVGGVHLILYPVNRGASGSSIGILAPDGRAKAFDDRANGTGLGEGVFALVLKPLERALEERDPIWGVILGSAVNSDGRSNGITAPSARAQAAVISEAWRRAGVEPAEISYVEAHGTGTKLGDPIEIEGLVSAFGRDHGRDAPCPIGSVKTNLGHLDTAAGLAGLVKVLVSMRRGQIPPSLHFETPNALIDFDGAPVAVNDRLRPWDSSGRRIAGVSSFGLSGTNCHVVVAEAPGPDGEEAAPEWTGDHVLALSARSWGDLRRQVERYRDHLAAVPDREMVDLCYTAAARRDVHGHRLAVLARDRGELRFKLRALSAYPEPADLEELTGQGVHFAVVTEPAAGEPVAPDSAEAAARAFARGERVDWEALFRGSGARSTLAPTYPLAPRRHWLDPAPVAEAPELPAPAVDREPPPAAPAPGPVPARPAVPPRDVEPVAVEGFLEETFGLGDKILWGIDLEPPPGYEEAIGRFCCQLIVGFFQSIGWLVEPGKPYHRTELFEDKGILPRYGKLIHVMLRHLEEEAVVRKEGERVVLSGDFEPRDVDAFRAECEARFPQYADCFNFPHYCSRHYREVLTGETSPLNVIYPGGDLEFQNRYRRVGDKLGDVYGLLTIEAVAKYVNALSRQRPVRILEAGAGMGAVTRELVPRLRHADGVEYYFTDLGSAFVKNARELFADYPFLRYQTFDITGTPSSQGLEEGTFDVVFAFNVIHTTRSIHESLANLRRALSPDGVLFVMESTKNETWSTLAWGLLEGWWLFEDYDLRPTDPMLGLDDWERVFADQGFPGVLTYPVDPRQRAQIEKALIVGAMKPLERPPAVTGMEETVSSLTTAAASAPPAATAVAAVRRPRPAGRMEDLVRETWEEVLEHEELGVDDDFFERGGDSLLAIKMLETFRTRLGVELEIADVFSYPTIRKLAAYIESEAAPPPPGPPAADAPPAATEDDDAALRALLDRVESSQVTVDEAVANLGGVRGE